MANYSNIGCLVLAAGHSRRFGSCKLMTPLGKSGEPILAHTLNTLSKLPVPVTVVTSLDRQDICLLASAKGCDLALMPAPSAGMADSIAFGISATTRYSGWLICLGDMPAITLQTFKMLLKKAPQVESLAPSYLGRRGHPVYFAKSYQKQLLSLKGDRGASSLFDGRLVCMPCLDPGILFDIDTSGDLSGYDASM